MPCSLLVRQPGLRTPIDGLLPITRAHPVGRDPQKSVRLESRSHALFELWSGIRNSVQALVDPAGMVQPIISESTLCRCRSL